MIYFLLLLIVARNKHSPENKIAPGSARLNMHRRPGGTTALAAFPVAVSRAIPAGNPAVADITDGSAGIDPPIPSF